MRIAVIGANGMLSVAITKAFIKNNHQVDVLVLMLLSDMNVQISISATFLKTSLTMIR
jgi:nucleoside-diphosphate-sugar epimerase